MSEFTTYPGWADDGGWRGMGRSSDPNDELFGQVVEVVTLEELRDGGVAVDAVIVGEPYDRAVIGRSGAREGPAEIRRSLARTKTHHVDRGPVTGIGDLSDVRSLVDAGTPGTDASVGEVQSTLRETTARVHATDALPVFLGGDNSLSYPNVAPLLDRGSVGVVNFDAHLDVREVREEPTSGTPYRQLLEAGLDRYVCLGARHFETSTAYHEYLDERGGTIVTAEALGDDPLDAVDRARDALADVDLVYVSVDCDVLDASAAPGVSAPTPGGISTRELFRCLRRLGGDDRLAGFEVVECAPPLDRNGLTADAAARAVAHVLAGYLGDGEVGDA